MSAVAVNRSMLTQPALTFASQPRFNFSGASQCIRLAFRTSRDGAAVVGNRRQLREEPDATAARGGACRILSADAGCRRVPFRGSEGDWSRCYATA